MGWDRSLKYMKILDHFTASHKDFKLKQEIQHNNFTKNMINYAFHMHLKLHFKRLKQTLNIVALSLLFYRQNYEQNC